ncbi:MAG: lipoate--protein ligase [Planctomycetota bacterium]|nr:MAG: lipoate--protein ligase [Planctomycetota bacterium]
MTPCRLIIDPPLEGAWNMAVDEALLEEAAERGTATLRFYQWAEPTLSLGYFQSYDERHGHAASLRSAVVRRSSGGGALVHDRELTYSICLPAAHSLARHSDRLYRVAHESLIAALAPWRLDLSLYGDQRAAAANRAQGHAESASPEAFLCFARRTGADVVVATDRSQAAVKICGSAQRRRRGALLQHGGVLLGQSPAAPELPGIEQLCAVAIRPEQLISRWQPWLAAALELKLAEAPLGDELIEIAQQLHRAKYSSHSWTRRR